MSSIIQQHTCIWNVLRLHALSVIGGATLDFIRTYPCVAIWQLVHLYVLLGGVLMFTLSGLSGLRLNISKSRGTLLSPPPPTLILTIYESGINTLCTCIAILYMTETVHQLVLLREISRNCWTNMAMCVTLFMDKILMNTIQIPY